MLRSALLSLLAATVLWAACTRASSAPGEPLGTFQFQAAELSIGGCPFRERPDGGFDFTGTFSVVDGGPTAFFTANGKTREGTFDGQRFESIYPGPSGEPVTRTFELDAGTCGTRFLVQETLRAVFLTAGQLQLPDFSNCQNDPEAFYVTGGPVDLDAGILPPSLGPEGYDAVGACGVLIEDIQPAEPCDLAACTLVYRLEGKAQ
jgi:hypothetical protein